MKPSRNEMCTYLRTAGTVPLISELLTDSITPIRIFSILKENYKDCYLLESVGNGTQWDRYSFIGFSPKANLRVEGGTIKTYDQDHILVDGSKGDPIRYIQDFLDRHRSVKLTYAPKFTGGLVGYFAYDMARFELKKLGNPPTDDIGLPDADLYYYDKIIAYDHLAGQVLMIFNVDREDVQDLMKNKSISFEQACDVLYEQKQEECRRLGYLLTHSVPQVQARMIKENPSPVHSDFSKTEFIDMVNRCKTAIRAGEISQVVVSQRFEVQDPPAAFDVYRQLRTTNPSPYLYYFDHEDYQIAGASPEMLVSVNDGIVTNKPIAGTMPRGKTTEEDLALEKQLCTDEKERAEHTMLVDLGRNDVGRVCRIGSVKVTDFMRVERYSKVMHLVSDVQGRLKPECTPLQALMSVLPAGTLSGAPKMRAMELIDEFEKHKRGVYGGTLGYLGLNGDIDTCICIRTVLFKNQKAYVQAGAGIVYDSNPENEYEECRRKASAVIEAIHRAERM
ncbi:anthranilate synthase component I [Catenisphaera adipataccumulans]|jgi:anthranilate synthase component 1|uniref:Anthranilate synthase component 1 n=1 Tax=Catenisphaera adipataccumulans TaxID=700500 RepID=A0A7W8CZJ5_9FIRM|nr:anthranilate synthase component I [Catenisphaera adipataccumulans]MBB5183244.1 anthranilate synthase component 1 [Catenisphaera adipataccumulans]